MLIATVSLPPEAVTLEQTLQKIPEIDLQAERIAAHSTEWTMPCLWVANADFEAVDEALHADPTVEDIVEMYEFDDEKYYQLEWNDTVIDRINSFIDQEGSILAAEATGDGWQLQIRFASRDQFDNLREYLDDQGHSFDLLELTEPGTSHHAVGRLTSLQRDALVAAMEHGYYMVPRDITAEDLAAKLDISQQALSERLRRGVENLINSTLATEDETNGE